VATGAFFILDILLISFGAGVAPPGCSEGCGHETGSSLWLAGAMLVFSLQWSLRIFHLRSPDGARRRFSRGAGAARRAVAALAYEQ